ncbi:hypothetical protein SAMN02745181_2097 [Rubritalea squalenifaciens DSM 18772]|uniref:Short C-terminal domain-containing protein n=1 Tax=Rubritalea squalenifaciens DSM 18772 TaxID=1123071 RepID=A0A1M6JE97_9BACT|nr:SHOCT domain-containing protein [Rubritalea squalenifaciens]SHJ45049.1 hypothetical protein SAMN02745181_2097 [Rubritalea squalenifaciens DSM 18772]
MHSIKPGRGPSIAGGVFCIFFTAVSLGMFILFATVIPDSAPQPIRIIFPLFPLGFVCLGVFLTVYNFKNATSKNRYSAFDITTGEEEPDPLNEFFNKTKPQATQDEPEESLETRLEKLQELKNKELLSDEEYSSQRTRILNSL